MTFSNSLLKLDSFATPVASINLKGEDKIRTLPGALISVAHYAFLLYIATLSFLQMINHENNKVQYYEVESSRGQI